MSVPPEQGVLVIVTSVKQRPIVQRRKAISRIYTQDEQVYGHTIMQVLRKQGFPYSTFQS